MGSVAGFIDGYIQRGLYGDTVPSPSLKYTEDQSDAIKDWKVKSIHYIDHPKSTDWFKDRLASVRNLSSPVLLDKGKHHSAYATIVDPSNSANTKQVSLENISGVMPIQFVDVDPAEFTGSVEVTPGRQRTYKQFMNHVTETYKENGGWSPSYNCQMFSQKTMMEASNATETPYEDAMGVDYVAATSETTWTIGFKWLMWGVALWSIYKFVRWLAKSFYEGIQEIRQSEDTTLKILMGFMGFMTIVAVIKISFFDHLSII